VFPIKVDLEESIHQFIGGYVQEWVLRCKGHSNLQENSRFVKITHK